MIGRYLRLTAGHGSLQTTSFTLVDTSCPKFGAVGHGLQQLDAADRIWAKFLFVRKLSAAEESGLVYWFLEVQSVAIDCI